MNLFRRIVLLAGWGCLLLLPVVCLAALPDFGTTMTRTSDTTLVVTFSAPATSTARTASNYSLGGAFTGKPTTVVVDASGLSAVLTVPSMTALTQAETVEVTGVTVAIGTATYTVDAVPDPFSFTSVSGASLATEIESNPVTITGINASVGVAASSGSSVTLKCASLGEGGTTWSAYGTCSSLRVSNNSQIKVKLTSSAAYATAVTGGIVIAGISSTFSVTTLANTVDTTPDAFSFGSISNALRSTETESDPVTITGITATVPVSLTPGANASLKCATLAWGGTTWGAYGTCSSATVSNNSQIKLKLTSSSAYATAVSGGITIGGVSGTFTVTTASVDNTPDSFVFTSVSNAQLTKDVESNPVTIKGITTTVAVAVTTDSSASLKCATLASGGTTWGTFGACSSATVGNNSQIKLKLTSSSDYATAVSGGITIGGVSGTFTVTTYDVVTAAPVPVPSGASVTALTSLTKAILSPDPSLYLSSNGLIVVPTTLETPISILSSAAVKTGIWVKGGATADFTLGGMSRVVTPMEDSGTMVMLLKNFKVDNYAGLQTLELVSGGAAVISTAGVSPVASMQLGLGTTTKQVAVLSSGGTAPSIELQVNQDGTGAVGVTSGQIVLRRASSESTIKTTDLPTTLNNNEVARLTDTGTVASIRLGSLSGDTGTNLGDALPITGFGDRASVPNVNGYSSRTGTTYTLLESLFDSIGMRSNLVGSQTPDGVVRLNINGASFFLMPFGDVAVNTTRTNGILLTTDGYYELTRNGVTARFRPSLFDPATFATAATSINAVVTMHANGSLEVHQGGRTFLMTPEMFTQQVTGAADGIYFDSAGGLVFATGGMVQRLLPQFLDMGQIATTFASLAPTIALQDNLNGTVTARLTSATNQTTEYTLTPDYELLSAVSGIPLEHRDDAWWADAEGAIYIKYSNGSAQRFLIR